MALVFGWIGCAHRRAQEQETLVAELATVGVRPELQEPTALGFFVKKRLPGLEEWLRQRIGAGWLSRPTVFLCWELKDEQVPYAIERIGQLGTVNEVHYGGRQLTEQGVDKLRSRLAGINVVPRTDPAQQQYFNSRTRGAQLALSGLLLEASLAIGLLGIVIAVAWSLVSRMWRRTFRATVS